MLQTRTVKVALLGAGSVGSQVARLLLEHGAELSERAGAQIDFVGIAVRNLDAPRDVELPRELLTTDARELILRADIVIELIGGIDPARELITLALESGADVVTANKALLAHHGPELYTLAERVGAQLHYEAAVAGAIPILRPLRDNLAGDRIERILGIVNGTTNFILDRMHASSDSFAESLRVATELGYAEADPTADIEGYDAQQKAAILASIAFHSSVPLDAVYREGISHITAEQIADAQRAGFVVKLLAICERVTCGDGRERVLARVHPTLISREHPLATVRGANNAVFVEAAAAGPLMFYGAGAGGVQTASAVLGDLVSAVRRHVLGGPGLRESTEANLDTVDMADIRTRYQIVLEVADTAGVLAEVARTFAEHGVSVATLEQTALADAPAASLVIVTHTAADGVLRGLVAALAELPVVARVTGVLRVFGGAE